MVIELTLEEKKKALNIVTDHIVGEYSTTYGPTFSRFAHWGDTASTIFLRALDDLGYDLVRKDNE